MSSTDINFDIHRPYSVYICSGKGNNYRDSGSYTAYGTSYLDAALRFARHWNHCTLLKTYGEKWKKSGRRARMPKRHCYLKDEKGNRLLMLSR
jgi:hypothetical protein